VGYRIGNERSRDKGKARITFVTAGWLLQKLVHTEGQSEFTHVLLDEVGALPPFLLPFLPPGASRHPSMPNVSFPAHFPLISTLPSLPSSLRCANFPDPSDPFTFPPSLSPSLPQVHERSIESDLLCFILKERLRSAAESGIVRREGGREGAGI